MFAGCKSLTSVPQFYMRAAQDLSGMFDGCTALESAVYSSDGNGFLTSGATDMRYMFHNCSSLKEVVLDGTRSATKMTNMFSGCSSLKKVTGITLVAVSHLDDVFPDLFESLQVLEVSVECGQDSTYVFIQGLSNWGSTEGEYGDEATESLRKSLCELTIDRAAKGWNSCALILHADVKARLTETEIAQITAKGYTIA